MTDMTYELQTYTQQKKSIMGMGMTVVISIAMMQIHITDTDGIQTDQTAQTMYRNVCWQ